MSQPKRLINGLISWKIRFEVIQGETRKTKIKRKEGVTMDKQERDKWQADSEHSFERAKKRAGLSKKKAAKLMELAKERGKGYEECR